MTNFSANQLLLLTNQICQSFAVIVFKFKDHRLLHKSHKVQTLAFSRKNFSSTDFQQTEQVHSQDTSTVVFVLNIFGANNTPSPKTAIFFLSAKKGYIFQNLLFSNFYASMEKSEPCHFK